MPSYNKVALSYNKATFLTEYAELGKMRSGAVAKTAVGHSLEKGGDAVGHERWTKVLRFLICFLMVLWIMAYIAPKAC